MIRFHKTLTTMVFTWAVISCGARPNGSDTKEAWDQTNSPQIISGEGLVSHFDSLPLSGSVVDKGWSDTYWPTYMGGISYRWMTAEITYAPISEDVSNTVFKEQSPAEKYDILLGRFDFPTVADERLRTRVLKTVEGTSDFVRDFEIPAWEGLCHGWAPAAQNFKEPKRSVAIPVAGGNTVVFYPSDIKALLIYYQQYAGNRSTRTVFAGQRCNEDFKKLQEQMDKGEISREQWQALRTSPQCRDTNAATLHLVLANEVGKARRGFVVDVTRDAEVWNQPVNSFESKIVGQKDGASPGAAEGTKKEVQVSTRMNYTVETSASQAPAGSIEKTAEYEYVLELDGNGAIIGGRWLSEDRPDFLWRESAPIFQGYFKRLQAIYNMSIAQ